MDLFVYGTLMDEEIFQIVAGERCSFDQAVLSGYIRKQVIDEVYPAIAEQPGEDVTGILYYNLSETALSRLDQFEGDQYDRRPVRVSLKGGEFSTAQAYVFAEKSQQRLAPEEWDFPEFLKRGKELFLNEYSGFRQLNRDSDS